MEDFDFYIGERAYIELSGLLASSVETTRLFLSENDFPSLDFDRMALSCLSSVAGVIAFQRSIENVLNSASGNDEFMNIQCIPDLGQLRLSLALIFGGLCRTEEVRDNPEDPFTQYMTIPNRIEYEPKRDSFLDRIQEQLNMNISKEEMQFYLSPTVFTFDAVQKMSVDVFHRMEIHRKHMFDLMHFNPEKECPQNQLDRGRARTLEEDMAVFLALLCNEASRFSAALCLLLQGPKLNDSPSCLKKVLDHLSTVPEERILEYALYNYYAFESGVYHKGREICSVLSYLDSVC